MDNNDGRSVNSSISHNSNISNNGSSSSSNSNSNSSFEAAFFASSPFLPSLAAFVRQQLLAGGGNDGDDAPPFSPEGKPATFTSLSPEVLGRLLHVNTEATAHAERQHPGKGLSSAADTTAAAAPVDGNYDGKAEISEENSVVREDGSVDWPRVGIAPDSEGEEATLVEGARLAVLCQEALQRQRQNSSSQARWMGGRLERAISGPGRLPFSGALQGVAERIVHGGSCSSSNEEEEEKEEAKEEVYAALCVCLAVLERALYDIHREGNGRPGASRDATTSVGVTRAAAATAAEGRKEGVIGDSVDSNGSGGGGGDEDPGGVRPAMILRDLIATPEVKAALPEKMVAVLRLLLLPLGFNIRNLVWHGFLAPHELPAELASLVLTVTISISDSAARDRDDSGPSLPRVESPIVNDTCFSPELESPSTSDGSVTSETAGSAVGDGRASVDLGRYLDPPPVLFGRLESCGAKTDEKRYCDNGKSPPPPPPPGPPHDQGLALPAWELSSFDDRLACPEALSSAVDSLLGEQHRGELSALVRRSAFVLPGREGMVLSALRALAEGRQAFFLVAILPILEHGLRCLFACANDSPAHLFAQLRQYYSTLDGFGQRARHQLLLDQEMSGCPGRPNLLLAALGPGLSACLLDLFMMSAGPCLRGKVAHGELDMSSIFATPSSGICSSSSTSSSTAGDSNESDKCSGGGGCGCGCGSGHVEKVVPSTAGVVSLTAGIFFALCGRYDIVERGLKGVPHFGNGGGGCSTFVEDLTSCDSHCSGWTSRFHPHELLEEDLRDSWTELGRLALALERRAISVEALPGVDLARMSVVISLCDGDDDDSDSGGNGENDNDSDGGSDGEGGGGDAVHPPATRRAPFESTRKSKQRDRQGARVTERDCGGSSSGGGGGGSGGGGDEIGSSVVEGGNEGSSLSGAPVAKLVVTLTDAASRLIPPPAEVEDRRPLPVSAKAGRGKVKGRGTTAGTSAPSGVFPGVLRVNDALRHHVASLTGRSRRAAHRGGQSGGRPRHSSGAPLDRPPGGRCRRPGTAPDEVRLSTFAVYMHSGLCRDATTCDLECLDRAPTDALGNTLRSTNTSTGINASTSTSICTSTSTSAGAGASANTSISTSTSSPLTSKASAEPRVDGATTSDKPGDRGASSLGTDEGVSGTPNADGTNVVINPDARWRRDTPHDARRGVCREGEDAGFGPERPDRRHGSIDGEDGSVRPRSEANSSPAPASTTATTTPTQTPATTPAPSPTLTPTLPPTPTPTPTLTPAPAPTPAPRTNRRFRRNRKPGRISPPTNVVTATPLPQIACMAGLCRSYADIARGLLARIGELEALLASGEARSGQRRAYAAALLVAPTLLRYLAAAAAAVEVFVVGWDARHDGEAFAAGEIGSGDRHTGSPPPPPPPPDGVLGSDSGAIGLGARRSPVPVAAAVVAAATAAEATEAGSAAAAGSTASVGLAAAAGSRDIAASLGFLRRLAAVNGSLALCVAAGAGGERSLTAGGIVGKEAGSGGGGSGVGGGGAGSITTARVEKSGGGGRKGYAQALAELASFLESKAARRGFAA